MNYSCFVCKTHEKEKEEELYGCIVEEYFWNKIYYDIKLDEIT
jgi:hypothetical protein